MLLSRHDPRFHGIFLKLLHNSDTLSTSVIGAPQSTIDTKALGVGTRRDLGHHFGVITSGDMVNHAIFARKVEAILDQEISHSFKGCTEAEHFHEILVPEPGHEPRMIEEHVSKTDIVIDCTEKQAGTTLLVLAHGHTMFEEFSKGIPVKIHRVMVQALGPIIGTHLIPIMLEEKDEQSRPEVKCVCIEKAKRDFPGA
jgi:hypothetical protein